MWEHLATSVIASKESDAARKINKQKRMSIKSLKIRRLACLNTTSSKRAHDSQQKARRRLVHLVHLDKRKPSGRHTFSRMSSSHDLANDTIPSRLRISHVFTLISCGYVTNQTGRPDVSSGKLQDVNGEFEFLRTEADA